MTKKTKILCILLALLFCVNLFPVSAFAEEDPCAESHEYESVTAAPSCTTSGFTTFTCSRCGESYVEEGEGAIGHDYVPVVTEPTCTTGGYTTFTCSRCGESYVEEGEGALGHDYGDGVVTEPSCTTAGYTTYTCGRCGDRYTEEGEGALGHNYDDGVVTVEPTADEEGVRTYTCSRCGDSYTESVPKLELEKPEEKRLLAVPTLRSEGTSLVVTLKAGDGTGADIVIDSSVEANMAESQSAARNGQFFMDGSTLYYKLPNCPNSFTAPGGSIFVGWSWEGTGKYQPGSVLTITGDLVLTALWEHGDFNISYNGITENGDSLMRYGSWDNANPSAAAAGDQVNLKIKSSRGNYNSGIRLQALIITQDNGTRTESTGFSYNYDFSYYTCSFTMPAANVTLNTRWETPSYFVTVTTDGNGTASANPEGGNTRTNVTLTAVPNDGYVFDYWESVSGGGFIGNKTDNPFSFRIRTDNVEAKAHFKRGGSYNVSVAVSPDNGGTVTGAGTYYENSTVTVSASPGSGYRFVNWSSNDGVNFADANASTTTFKSPAHDVTVTANFEVIPATTTYTVSASVNDNIMGTVTGAGTYDVGATVTLTATANEGYTFVNWTENGSVIQGAGATYSFTAEADRNLVANFAEKETVAAPTFSPAAGAYAAAQAVTISCATDGAAIYYTTDGTEPTTGSTVYSGPISVSETTTIKAIAVKDGMNNSEVASAAYTITPPATTYGITTVYCSAYLNIEKINAAESGETITVSADPETFPKGKYFTGAYSSDDVTVSVNEVGDGTFTMPDKSVSVTAVLADREETTIDLTGTAAAALPAGMAEALCETDYYLNGGLDLNGDGTVDVLLDTTNNTAQRGEGAGSLTSNVAVSIENPGLPYRYKSVTFKVISTATYTVTVNNGSGGGEYAAGASVTITANDPETGKVFKKWTGTDGLTFTSGSSTTATATFTMPAQAVTVTATYEDIPATTYAVTVNSGTGSGDYAEGASVTITANAPETGKQFKEWTGADGLTFTSGSKTSSTATFTMPARAVTVTATYEEIPVTSYTVTVTNGMGGGEYTAGASVTITANASEPGKQFKEWTGTDGLTFTSGSKTSSTATFTMPSNAVTVTATYEDIPATTYAVTVNSGTGSGDYAEGARVTITANAPETGKQFKEWTGAAGLTFTEGSTSTATATFTMPAQAVTVTATYALKEYQVSFNTNGGTAVSEQTVTHGETAKEPAAPTRNGFLFGGWYQDATLSIPFAFTTPIVANTTLYARWIPISYRVISGADATWWKSSGVNLTITVKRSEADDTCFSHFTGVRIDGQTLVNGTDYTAAAGSTVITLKSAKLQTLSTGVHTVRIDFDDGYAVTDLTVKASSGGGSGGNNGSSGSSGNSSPKTGDESQVGLWIMVMAASGFGLFGIASVGKSRRRKS